MGATERRRIRVAGVVQGVGFRPFVHGLATRLRLSGFVGNDADGVFGEVEGPAEVVTAFVARLRTEAPPLAVVTAVRATPVALRGDAGFRIVDSPAGGERRTLVAPDAATCADCLREMADPTDRRYGYAFTNCTGCGPRFTIVRDVPYDRPRTTMADFVMCGSCRREYDDPADRRFHAQPVCCPACGPTLRLVDGAGRSLDGDPVLGAARLLRAGRVVAVKGLGGYHLAALAASEAGVAALRSRKHREDKPFAVLVPDLAAAAALCVVSTADLALLTGPAGPIVLLPRRPDGSLARSVAPASRNLGILLPYTPLHHLLAGAVAAPFVLTSGNVSDEPIAYRDDDALARLAGIADAFLLHDRAIHVRTDDSVVRPVRGAPVPLRRSRGYAPSPILLSEPLPRPVLACGAELKNTFCVAKGGTAFVSHHIGDLENYETLRSFLDGIEHYCRLFDVRPEVVAHDLHPEYLSTKWAVDRLDVDLVGVQHHHAHIASCLAEHGERGPVIGVAYDGLGYGEDGTLWGGELLVADLAGYLRVGGLAPVPMPGGAAAVREPWRMAAAYLHEAYGDQPPAGLAVRRRSADQWAAVTSLARSRVHAPLTSSAGRLFDAVAALVGVRDTVTYEGQAAVGLEQLCDPGERSCYPAGLLDDGGLLRIQGVDLVRAVVADLRAGVPAPRIASRFHLGLADATVAACRRVGEERGLGTVALSGGVFQNAVLTTLVADELERHGFRVLLHRRVPPNDGGVSLGQVVVAGARDARAGPPAAPR